MRTSSAFQAVLCLCASAALGGCATQFTDDVELRSVEAVYLEGDAGWSYEGWIPDAGGLTKNPPHSNDPRTLRLKVTFATSINLPRFTKDKGHSLRIDEHFCDSPDEDLLMTASSVYVPEQKGRPTLSWWAEQKVDPPLEYFFLLDIKGAREETRHFTYHAFDLRNEPRDVCFILRGGAYLKLGYKSNTVVIPAARMKAALSNLPAKGL